MRYFQSTSGGEPHTLLNALKPMLGCLGDIKAPQEVVRIIRYDTGRLISLLYNCVVLVSKKLFAKGIMLSILPSS